MYACLSGLPCDKISVSSVTKALVPYFKHKTATVEISARNAAQFLVPEVDEASRHHFILTSAFLRLIFYASGKDMPISSTLKLLLVYGQVTDNCATFLREGVYQYAHSVMFTTTRSIEKQLAFSVILMLSLHLNRKRENVKKSDKFFTAQGDVATPPVVTHSSQNLFNLLTELSEQAQMFVTTLDQSCGKEAFESFRKLLNQLEGEHVNSSGPNLDESSVSKRMSNTLQNIIVNLLEGNLFARTVYIYVLYVVLAANIENQVSRYANLMIFECWECLKKLGRDTKSPLHIQDISQLIDKDLTVITVYLERKSMNEVCKCNDIVCHKFAYHNYRL